ncbi:site-specific integrase [Leisingera sp. ANG59]|uniref:tyrosine-type recombinase/integrase n=1 Tax=Leisingera sp. ANG59 TaxID=2675221 RepID=UPI0020C62F1C|nr:site-specific integrase [Leisingera sp. ANG59]
MRLYDRAHQRLYINADERRRFLRATLKRPLKVRCFCLILLYTGCRISEALVLTAEDIQPATRVITFRTLKRRNPHKYREVPVPPSLVELFARGFDLEQSVAKCPLWQNDGQPLNRSTAYRWVKSVMAEAKISGAQACPKGLRHGYGIHAIRSGVQLNMLQKWMGHASMSTTAIYANAIGAEELAIADRMWAD